MCTPKKPFLAVSVFFTLLESYRVRLCDFDMANHRGRVLVRVLVFQYVSSVQFRAISAPRTPYDVETYVGGQLLRRPNPPFGATKA